MERISVNTSALAITNCSVNPVTMAQDVDMFCIYALQSIGIHFLCNFLLPSNRPHRLRCHRGVNIAKTHFKASLVIIFIDGFLYDFFNYF